MLADEVTHVKMGSDWLRRLTDKDPERRERALEFQRTVDSDLQPRRLPRRGRGEPDPARAPLPRLAGFTDDENDSLAELARQSTEQAREMAEMALPRCTRRPRALAASDEFGSTSPRSLHAHRLRRGRDRGDRRRLRGPLVGLPSNVEIDLVVDEELFAPLVGHTTDVVDGTVQALDLRRQLRGQQLPRHFSQPQAERDFTLQIASRPRTASPTTSRPRPTDAALSPR